MPLIESKVIIPHVNGVQGDAATNTFTWDVTRDADDPAMHADIVQNLAILYTEEHIHFGANRRLSTIYPNTVSPNWQVRLYDVTVLPRGEPLFVSEAFPVPIGAGAAFPGEVGLNVSWERDGMSGVKKARRQGGIRLGPFAQGAGTHDGFGNSRPEVEWTNWLSQHFALMFSGWAIEGAEVPVIVSRGARDNSNTEIPYRQRPLLPPMVFIPNAVFVDNAWDTQRSRGVDPTDRVVTEIQGAP